jgi:hypothetical protein
MPSPECSGISDQLRRAFDGDPWHGPPIRDLLTGVTTEQAGHHPLPSAHSIWELVLHIDLYVRIASEAISGTPMPKLFGTEQDWPPAGKSQEDWDNTVATLFRTAEELAKAIESFSDDRLAESVPGRDYNFYYLFHGVVQHSLYHAGQIAMLKKSFSSS